MLDELCVSPPWRQTQNMLTLMGASHLMIRVSWGGRPSNLIISFFTAMWHRGVCRCGLKPMRREMPRRVGVHQDTVALARPSPGNATYPGSLLRPPPVSASVSLSLLSHWRGSMSRCGLQPLRREMPRRVGLHRDSFALDQPSPGNATYPGSLLWSPPCPCLCLSVSLVSLAPSLFLPVST